MSDGTLGYGASLDLDSTTNFTASTTIGNISTIGIGDETWDTIDISTMDSSDKYREFIQGMADAGEITLEMNYDGAASGTANDINTLKTNTSNSFKITINDHTTATSKSNIIGNCFFSSIGMAIPFDDKITQSITMKISGKPTFTDQA